MRTDPQKTVTLVLGGARSGKSRYAQELASAFKRVVFIATARRDDAEMRAKIARHRRERPASWKTLELSTGLDRALREQCRKADLLIIDCLTLYLAKAMERKRGDRRQVHNHIQSLCEAIREAKASVVIVSNEVGCGVVPSYRSGREYRDLLGEFNRQIAQVADRVILMVAGLPLAVKDSSVGPKIAGKKGKR
ncbi:MAG TPA: bifunctional adenosylcobinamide kinase/adenosylcobinamide-phosphate guanylyltransferase [Terriglobia bacterium]|nr:bifunctional adenosylcobinamide kinase/adenosylcobinamide-phosphate guanylyltransferase [Terriglobia bacterium]